MGSAVIFVVLILIVVLALKGSRKHFRGEGGCCGGGDDIKKSDIPVKKLPGEKLGEKTVSITGMRCEGCVLSVTKAINRIEGASADVSLKKKRAIVSYDREISDEDIRAAVERAGYKVSGISG
ncbi:MAG: heavy-metal-associated domain-containing protein [Clostridiales bacterium]|nr:heavy-metal-associated domain-containing protein [Clostridiales bacterium]